MSMETILKFLAVFSSGIFTGAAFYLTTVEHPARMSLGVEAALEEFRPSYKRAAPQQAALTIVCFLSSAALDGVHARLALASGRQPRCSSCAFYVPIHDADESAASKRYGRAGDRIGESAPCKMGTAARRADNPEPLRLSGVALGVRRPALTFRRPHLQPASPLQ